MWMMNDDTLLYFLLVLIKYSLAVVKANPNQPTEVLRCEAQQFPWWSPLSSPPYKWFPSRTSYLDHWRLLSCPQSLSQCVDSGGSPDQPDPSQSVWWSWEPIRPWCCRLLEVNRILCISYRYVITVIYSVHFHVASCSLYALSLQFLFRSRHRSICEGQPPGRHS